MAPVGEGSGTADVAAGLPDEVAPGAGGGAGGASAAGAAGAKKGSYVPPAMRNAGAGGRGESMGSKYGERDDFATLRVTNVSTLYLRLPFSDNPPTPRAMC